MPLHLIRDAHEWINKIPTVLIYYLAKLHRRSKGMDLERTAGKEDPVEFDSSLQLWRSISGVE